MCSQTMMSSTETLQGFKVTKAFSGFPCERAAPQHTAERHRGRRLMDETEAILSMQIGSRAASC